MKSQLIKASELIFVVLVFMTAPQTKARLVQRASKHDVHVSTYNCVRHLGLDLCEIYGSYLMYLLSIKP